MLKTTNRVMTRQSPTFNKPLAIMAVEVKTQASVLWKNISDYPQCSALNPPQ